MLAISSSRCLRSSSSSRAEYLLEGQRRYLNYRAEKDPARSMLTRFYGKEWTESYIHNILFN